MSVHKCTDFLILRVSKAVMKMIPVAKDHIKIVFHSRKFSIYDMLFTLSIVS